jgi:hypothetical protein
MGERLLQLPKAPGTVNAIGDWWLVRLRPYENGYDGSWELLPFRSADARTHAASLNVRSQCVYSEAWVLTEAEQEGHFTVISEPLSQPYTFGYQRATSPASSN